MNDKNCTAAAYHFSVGGMGSGTGFENWMTKMRKKRKKMRRKKRKSIFGNVQRNCNWIFATSCVGGRGTGTGTGTGMRKTTMRMRRKMLRWSGWTQS